MKTLFALLALPWLTFSSMNQDVTNMNRSMCPKSGPVVGIELRDGEYIAWISVGTNRATIAQYKDAASTEVIRLWYVTGNDDKITIVKEQVFDPIVHKNPCQWLDGETT